MSLGGREPRVDGNQDLVQRGLGRLAVRGAVFQVGNVGDKRLVFRTEKEVDVVL